MQRLRQARTNSSTRSLETKNWLTLRNRKTQNARAKRPRRVPGSACLNLANFKTKMLKTGFSAATKARTTKLENRKAASGTYYQFELSRTMRSRTLTTLTNTWRMDLIVCSKHNLMWLKLSNHSLGKTRWMISTKALRAITGPSNQPKSRQRVNNPAKSLSRTQMPSALSKT